MLVLAAAVALATPGPSPTPLKTITTIRVSPLCSVLREDVGQAIQGIVVNDRMFDESRMMMYKVRRDAMAAPLGIGWSGGAGPASSLDDVQMNNLVGVLAANLAKIDALLSNANVKDSRLDAAKAQLERVVVAQRASLNILSENVLSNESNDLQSRRALAPSSESEGPVRISLAEELAAQRAATERTETGAALSVKPLIDACRGRGA